MTEKLRLSTSRINTYLHCPKSYWWHYHEDLVPKKKSYALQVGDFVHILLAKDALGELTQEYISNFVNEVQKAYPDNINEESAGVAYDALNYFSGYKDKYKYDPLTIDSVEVHLELDLGPYLLYTRLDTLVRTQDKRLWRGEYKTTAKLDSGYLSGLKDGLQAGISYWVESEVLPERVNGTIYSLIVKTKIPQYERSMVLAEKGLIERTKACVHGVADNILNERFYPSMQCHYYKRECEYLPLCKNDSERTREAFFEKRVEFYNKPKS
jgi:hypothetical protein